MSDKNRYEVIARNCLDYEVGEIIELTDKKAESLVNKVKPTEIISKKAAKKVAKKSEDGGKDI